jgi:tRNA (uracil-5-)-methyltransferase
MKKKKKKFIELAREYRGSADPVCSHFGECGGCQFQDISYDNQLVLKKKYLNSIFEGFEIETVRGGGPFRYRNRMDFVAAFGKIGLRRAGSFRHVVDIASCAIMQERSDEAYKTARKFMSGIEDYDYLRHEGYLRYIVLRQARFTGQLMLNFVAAKRENRLENVIRETIGIADSMSIILSDGMADLSYGEVIEDIKAGFIEENFDGIRFRMAPNSFFQSNSEISAVIYKKIKEECGGRVLDLYSGVGSISLYIAGNAESVTGVEVLKEAVDMANVNREINSIGNADFVCADALEFIKDAGGRFDTVILDPPRSGMNPKVIRYLREISPEKIIYLSCNPDAFKNDLQGLENYSMRSIEAFDMFPQTPHIETLAVLGRK